jgi:uncharacterized protein involved in exopolysaccharide biosynthesis
MADQQNQRLPPVEDEISLLDYWRVIWKYKRFIGVLFSIAVLSALVFSLISPKIYESTVTIITPRETAGTGLLSALGAIGVSQQNPGMSLPSLSPNRDIFISIMKSRTVAQSLVEQFSLGEHYKSKHFEDAIKSLKGATKISVSKEGVILVKVEDRNPQLAADIANAYTTQLDRLMTRFGTGRAGNQRRFVSEQLVKIQEELNAAEENLRQFQERNRAILLGDMANSMRLPTAQVPKVGIEMVRLMRDLKVQEAVYTFLTQQLEQAKIGEAQDMPVVQVLDRAVPPVHKSKPKTLLNMALAGAVSLFLGILVAFLLQYIQCQKQQMANRELDPQKASGV